MLDLELGEMQSDFADLIWEKAPIASGELVKLAEERFHWKKSTTYTMLRILCHKGLFKNTQSIVSPELSREEYYLKRSEQTIKRGFGGSVPAFMVAFSASGRLTEKEVTELEKLIREYRDKRKEE